MVNITKNVRKRLFFCIKLMQNHVEMCFKIYVFSGCCQHVFCVSGIHLLTT